MPGRFLIGWSLLYYLNLGCGARFHSDWINLDIEPQSPEVGRHDFRQPLPLPDECCAAVYCSHVLEHFSRAAAPNFLGECHRVLQPGGIVRVVVPDLETIARLYLQNFELALAGDTAAESRHEWMTIELFDQMVREESGGEMRKYWCRKPMPQENFILERAGDEVRRALKQFSRDPAPLAAPSPPKPSEIARFRDSGEVHKWMYDRLSLRRLLEKSGFVNPQTCRADESRVPGFNHFQLDIDETGAVRKPDSLFMEALKPAG